MAWDAYRQARSIVAARLADMAAELAAVGSEHGVTLVPFTEVITSRKPCYTFPYVEVSTLSGPVSLEGRSSVNTTLDGWAIVYDRDADEQALDDRIAGYGTAVVRKLLLAEGRTPGPYVLTVTEVAATPPGADTDSAGWVQAVGVRWRLDTVEPV